jgi:hypothetical protein
MSNNYAEINLIGVHLVGPNIACESLANPSEKLLAIDLEMIKSHVAHVIAVIQDIRTLTPLERTVRCHEIGEREEWKLAAVLQRFRPTKLLDLKNQGF